ncbi:hypothetical protein D6D08_05796 [Aureobasidium pullulans]|nr:hypothetical protein D6D08_05796 [Aureobasidium pullulans]
MAIHTPPHARAASTVSHVSNQNRHDRTPEGQRTVSLQTALASTPASAASLAPYNPAAPSAPEPIAHREKTPPPVDAGNGTGLSVAATHEQPGQYTTAGAQYRHQISPQSTFPGPPQRATSIGSFPPPPPLAAHLPHPGLQTAHSFAGPPTSSQSHTPQQQYDQTQYASYPQQQSAHYPQSPGLHMQTPLQSPGIPNTPGQPPAFGLPPTPHGDFSNYTYGPQAPQTTSATEAYSVHTQTYRPTEQEVAHGYALKVQQQARTKLGGFKEWPKKTEKGVGILLRKLDQKM